MITPKNIIYSAMYNKGIRTISDLTRLMNVDSSTHFYQANTNSTVEGTHVYAHYMRRIEKVLGFPDKSLLNMYEESNGPLKNKT